MSDHDKIPEKDHIESDESILGAVDWLLLSPQCPPLPEEVIDALLPPPKTPMADEKIANMQNDLTERTLAQLHPRPIRRLKGRATFSLYLKETRKIAGLNVEEIARFLDKPIPHVEQIESGKILPWQIPTSEAAKIVMLYRIHFEGVRQLVLASITASEGREQMLKERKNASRHRRRLMEAESTQEIEDFTDEVYASLADDSRMTDEVAKWLGDLYEEFERLNATEFIEK